ncbi:hypothetical protein [Pseudomonas extremaustralis]|uniref:hypothetical protein n=1 Tax=Pseudomonas extremaustralis TaxID=359110 RepID=UPI002307F96D|nr:hypothetical protein [Pseudomonas extremaustralis]MDB1114012.1 hypothetical protein [Pseudomonas extremaustralis]
MTSFKFGTVILLLYLAGCTTSGAYRPPPVPAAAVTLNDEQIHDTLMGKRLYGTTLEGGHPYSISFSPDGVDVFEMAPNPPEREHWTLNQGVVCVIPKDYPKECSQVKVADNEYWFVDPKSGKVNAHLKLKP